MVICLSNTTDFMLSRFSLDTYPTKSEPPVQFKAKFNLPPKPTAIKSMKFSSTFCRHEDYCQISFLKENYFSVSYILFISVGNQMVKFVLVTKV